MNKNFKLVVAALAPITVISSLVGTYIYLQPAAQRVSHVTVAMTAQKPLPVAATTHPVTTTLVATNTTHELTGPLANINLQKLISVSAAAGLKPKALKAALNSYAWASDHGKLGSNKHTLTVIDFTLPSYEKRMWVLDLSKDKVLMKLYTTHGKGSGLAYATHFSNQGSTETSSLGLYVTGEEYYGRHDKSMRIIGLEKGINSNALSRSIVIHSAYYATPEYIRSHHLAGRSWGCFAVAPAVKDQLLNDIKGSSVLFTYAAPEDHDPIVKKGPIAIV